MKPGDALTGLALGLIVAMMVLMAWTLVRVVELTVEGVSNSVEIVVPRAGPALGKGR